MLQDTWNRAFADGREEALMGGSAEKLLEAFGKLSLDGNPDASCFVEAPLFGKPEYDSLVIHNPRYYYPGCRILDPSIVKAQKALDWAAGQETIRPWLYFELDAGGLGRLSGIYCRMEEIGRAHV